jgi:hypothetical protein
MWKNAMPFPVPEQRKCRGFGAVGGLVGANNSDSKQRVPVVRLSLPRGVSATHPITQPQPNDPTGTAV